MPDRKRYRVVTDKGTVAYVAANPNKLPTEQDLRDAYRVSPFQPIWLEEVVVGQQEHGRGERGRGRRGR